MEDLSGTTATKTVAGIVRHKAWYPDMSCSIAVNIVLHKAASDAREVVT